MKQPDNLSADKYLMEALIETKDNVICLTRPVIFIPFTLRSKNIDGKKELSKICTSSLVYLKMKFQFNDELLEIMNKALPDVYLSEMNAGKYLWLDYYNRDDQQGINAYIVVDNEKILTTVDMEELPLWATKVWEWAQTSLTNFEELPLIPDTDKTMLMISYMCYLGGMYRHILHNEYKHFVEGAAMVLLSHTLDMYTGDNNKISSTGMNYGCKYPNDEGTGNDDVSTVRIFKYSFLVMDTDIFDSKIDSLAELIADIVVDEKATKVYDTNGIMILDEHLLSLGYLHEKIIPS